MEFDSTDEMDYKAFNKKATINCATSYGLLNVNSAMLIAGIVAFTFGLSTLSNTSFTYFMSDNSYIISSVMVTISGLLLVLIASLAIYGVIREYYRVILVCLILYFATFGFSVFNGILGFNFKNQFDEQKRHQMLLTIANYSQDATIRNTWDSIQKNFNCCGLSTDGLESFYIYVRFNKEMFGLVDTKVPESCCKYLNDLLLVLKCTSDPTNAKFTFQDDCFESVKNFVDQKMLFIVIIAIYNCFLLILAIIISCSHILLLS